MMLGKWTGWYGYDNPYVEKVTGKSKFGYTIFIKNFKKNSFSGTVQDDPKSSIMHEEGKIEGFIKGNKIFFKKLMPVSYEFDTNGKPIQINKPHPTIYYKGVIDKSTMKAKGTWYFNLTFGFLFRFIPIPFRPGRGKWEMNFEDSI